jgi:hypothetical protein
LAFCDAQGGGVRVLVLGHQVSDPSTPPVRPMCDIGLHSVPAVRMTSAPSQLQQAGCGGGQEARPGTCLSGDSGVPGPQEPATPQTSYTEFMMLFEYNDQLCSECEVMAGPISGCFQVQVSLELKNRPYLLISESVMNQAMIS